MNLAVGLLCGHFRTIFFLLSLWVPCYTLSRKKKNDVNKINNVWRSGKHLKQNFLYVHISNNLIRKMLEPDFLIFTFVLEIQPYLFWREAILARGESLDDPLPTFVEPDYFFCLEKKIFGKPRACRQQAETLQQRFLFALWLTEGDVMEWGTKFSA